MLDSGFVFLLLLCSETCQNDYKGCTKIYLALYIIYRIIGVSQLKANGKPVKSCGLGNAHFGSIIHH